MKLSSREKVLLIILVVAGLGYLFYSLLYHPIINRKDALVQENSKLKKQVELYSSITKQNAATDSEAEKQRLQNKFREQAVKLPGEALLPECMVYLQKSARESRITICSYTLTPGPAAATPGAAPTEMKISLTVKGGYSSLRAFLLCIEKAPRLYRIDGAKMSSNYQLSKPTPPAPIATTQPGEEALPVEAIPVVKNEITTNISLTTFYQAFPMPEMQDNQERVQPGKGQDNPFSV